MTNRNFGHSHKGMCMIHNSEELVRECGLERFFRDRSPHDMHYNYNELIIIIMTKTVNNHYN